MGVKSYIVLLLAILFVQNIYVSPVTSLDIFTHAKDYGDVIEYEIQPSFLDRVLGGIKYVVMFPLEVLHFVLSPFIVPLKVLSFAFKALLFPLRMIWQVVTFPFRFLL